RQRGDDGAAIARGLRVTNRTFGMLLRSGFPAGHHHADASSAWTSMDSSSGPPNVVAMATSEASRPRPIRIRPLRGVLLRGSKVHQRSPSQPSIQAAKSIGAGSGGTSMSGRYPKTYRAGMFSARQNEMARWG